jgi:hypothetical protein
LEYNVFKSSSSSQKSNISLKSIIAIKLINLNNPRIKIKTMIQPRHHLETYFSEPQDYFKPNSLSPSGLLPRLEELGFSTLKARLYPDSVGNSLFYGYGLMGVIDIDGEEEASNRKLILKVLSPNPRTSEQETALKQLLEAMPLKFTKQERQE